MTTAFQPGERWPDNNGVHINAHGGGILFHEGVYYWFGEHKIAGTAGNYAQVGVHCYTSRDLYHWTDAGIALAVSDDPDSDITAGCILERPKVLFNPPTGKFVMWFHLELRGAGYSAARCGVAVADAPTGPYRYLESFRPNAGVWPLNMPEEANTPLTAEEIAVLAAGKYNGGPDSDCCGDLVLRRDYLGGQMARDMTLFVDADGAAYHIFASEENSTLHISQLSEDFLRPAGRYVRIFPGRYNEAPALLARHGKYYLFSSGCTGWQPNPARLAVADSIWGPWTELGNPCVGSEAEVNTTFDAQSTYILPVAGLPDAYIFLADRWRPNDAIDGRYVWLPVQFAGEQPFIAWLDQWDLSVFAG